MHHLPELDAIWTDCDQILTVLRELEICDSFIMFMLESDIIVELCFIKLDDIEHFLSLFELLSHFHILESIGIFHKVLSFCNEIFKDGHTFLSFAH